MHHGGPYPATTDARATSVGTAAIQRFARPVCYQDFPQAALPEELAGREPAGHLAPGRRRPHPGSAVRPRDLPESIEVVDSHTGGRADARRRSAGWPELEAPTMEGRREELDRRFDPLLARRRPASRAATTRSSARC